MKISRSLRKMCLSSFIDISLGVFIIIYLIVEYQTLTHNNKHVSAYVCTYLCTEP